jgi:hypothetical protein
MDIQVGSIIIVLYRVGELLDRGSMLKKLLL